ncbi:MAG: bifunctional methionine sulfoxide reductase B/A protein [Phycisphaerales bacterium JB060]
MIHQSMAIRMLFITTIALVATAVAVASVLQPMSGITSQSHREGATMTTTQSTSTETVSLRVFDHHGNLVGPIALPRFELTEAQWKERLSPEAFKILRKAGTEAAFCGTLLDNKKEGVYACAGCSLPLFASDAKFQSGTGWPSFYKPVASENINIEQDTSHGMVRTEILCARCDGHLGHVFNDGPEPTGMRFCVNSESLAFTDADDLASLGEVAVAYFAGGCFWCVEGVFEQLKGVHDVTSGYTGGHENPETLPVTYKQVTTGATGHAESVRIVYDPNVISYEALLEVHFATHDPTTLNRQGGDVGTHYRSAIFYANDQEKQAAAEFMKKLEASNEFEDPIVTTLEPLNGFQVAEDYHQNYAELNPDQPYICNVATPKIEKVRAKFPQKVR